MTPPGVWATRIGLGRSPGGCARRVRRACSGAQSSSSTAPARSMRRGHHGVPVGVAGAVHEGRRSAGSRAARSLSCAESEQLLGFLLLRSEPCAARSGQGGGDEQHVLAGIVVHLPGGADVVVRRRRPSSSSGRQHRGGLVPGPGEVVAVVVETHVGVLAGGVAALRDRPCTSRTQRTMPRATSAYSSVPKQGVGVEIGLEQLGVVVGHLLEVGHDPLGVHAVAVEAAAELVVASAPRHPLEGPVDDACGSGRSGGRTSDAAAG